MKTQQTRRIEPWMRGIMLLAGFYNIGWGIFINQFPDAFYQWITMASRAAPPLIIWQGLGVLLFGVAYGLLAMYPTRLWWLLVLGIFSKAFGAVGFSWIFMEGTFNKRYLFHLIMNDLIWLIPFVIILQRILTVKKVKKEMSV